MELEILKSTAALPQFGDKRLNSATKRIAKCATAIKKNYFEIGATLALVDETKAYEADGFKSAAEYAMKTFSIKKTAAYSLIKIGRDFTDKEKYESLLPHEDGHDFTTSQVEKMLPLPDVSDAIDLVSSGAINPDMTCAEISKVVKAYNNGLDYETDSESEEPPVTEPNEDTNEVQEDFEAFASAVYTNLNNLIEWYQDTDNHEKAAWMRTILNEFVNITEI